MVVIVCGEGGRIEGMKDAGRRGQEEVEAQEVGSSLSRSAQPPFTAVLWSVLSQPSSACSCAGTQAVQPRGHMLLDVRVCVHNVLQ